MQVRRPKRNYLSCKRSVSHLVEFLSRELFSLDQGRHLRRCTLRRANVTSTKKAIWRSEAVTCNFFRATGSIGPEACRQSGSQPPRPLWALHVANVTTISIHPRAWLDLVHDRSARVTAMSELMGHSQCCAAAMRARSARNFRKRRSRSTPRAPRARQTVFCR